MKKVSLSPRHAAFLRSARRRQFLVRLCQCGILILFLFLWELLASNNIIDQFIMSSPSRICKTIALLSASGELWQHVWISTEETMLGFLIGTFLGSAAAVVLWWSPLLNEVLEPYVVVLNSLPKIALGPVIIIWVGTGKPAIITMAVLISVVITTITMLGGFLETSADKILLLRTLHATKTQIFCKLVLPANLPTLASTLKINVGMSWVGSIMGEYLVSKAGLGYLIVYGSQVFQLDLVMACTLLLCLLAGVMYFLVAALEKLFLKWQ